MPNIPQQRIKTGTKVNVWVGSELREAEMGDDGRWHSTYAPYRAPRYDPSWKPTKPKEGKLTPLQQRQAAERARSAAAKAKKAGYPK